MDYDAIRKMSDEELELFLQRFKWKSTKRCSKCGKDSEKILKIENNETLQRKQLCGLCNDCYKEMLNFLNVSDIDWR